LAHSRNRRRQTLTRLAVLTAAAAIAAYGLVLLYGLLTGVVGGLPVLNATVPRIILYLAALVVLVQSGLVIAGTGPRNSGAAVVIDPGLSTATVAIEITTFTGRPWPLPSRLKHAQERVPIPGSMMPELRETRIHELLRAAGRPGQPLRVSLLVAGPLVAVAWEVWLGVPLNDTEMYLGRPYRALLETAAQPGPQRDNTCWVLAPPRWRTLVRNAVPLVEVDFPSRFPPAAPGDVLIAVAIAVDTPTGRRLVVHNGVSRDNDLVIDPDEAALAGLTVVLAGEPRAGRRRLSATRSAAALRACAADLIEAGARTVIVVPNAPSAVTSRVLHGLTTTIRPGESHAADVLSGAVDQARKVLAQEADAELGFELTVMSRALP
jgi:hypothetical protein